MRKHDIENTKDKEQRNKNSRFRPRYRPRKKKDLREIFEKSTIFNKQSHSLFNQEGTVDLEIR